MHYVTERAVFELRPEGPVLTEIAPVSILSATSLAHMDFHPAIAADLQVMDSRLFAPPPCGLANICPGIHPLTHKERCYETCQ